MLRILYTVLCGAPSVALTQEEAGPMMGGGGGGGKGGKGGPPPKPGDWYHSDCGNTLKSLYSALGPPDQMVFLVQANQMKIRSMGGVIRK